MSNGLAAVPNKFHIDRSLVERMIKDFTSATTLEGEVAYTCIFQSTHFGGERLVFKVTIGTQDFAMKVDTTGADSGRLASEFAVLQQMDAHFARFSLFSSPKPLFCSPDGTFFVTNYLRGKTARTAVRSSENPQVLGQVFRRAGGWLHALHLYRPAETARAWPNWMVTSANKARARDPQASEAQYSTLLTKLKTQASEYKGKKGFKAFCHGDFHADNLILDRGITHGFDFTEAKQKLALYDIVDFLKIDACRTGVLDDVDRSGVTRHCKSMFFKLYRHPIESELLDFCLRGRLLIDWLSIQREQYERSCAHRNRFERLHERLRIAFAA